MMSASRRAWRSFKTLARTSCSSFFEKTSSPSFGGGGCGRLERRK
jgi:hypothetical protein